MARSLFVVAAVAGAMLASAAHAEGVTFAGVTAAADPSAYAGVLAPIPGGKLGSGLAVRLSVNGGGYSYDAGRQKIKARYGGGDLSAMYQFSGSWGYANVSVGPRYGYTHLRPNDPGSSRRGSSLDAIASSDGALVAEKWRMEWYGLYGTGVKDYQAKLFISRAAAPGLRLGLEGGVQGDPSYSRVYGGAGAAVRLAGSDFRVTAGASDQKGRGTRGYLTIAFSRSF